MFAILETCYCLFIDLISSPLSVNPTYGPESGGTVIIVSGVQGNHNDVPQIYLADAPCPMNLNERLEQLSLPTNTNLSLDRYFEVPCPTCCCEQTFCD